MKHPSVGRGGGGGSTCLLGTLHKGAHHHLHVSPREDRAINSITHIMHTHKHTSCTHNMHMACVHTSERTLTIHQAHTRMCTHVHNAPHTTALMNQPVTCCQFPSLQLHFYFQLHLNIHARHTHTYTHTHTHTHTHI